MTSRSERCPKCDARSCSCEFDQRELDYSSAMADMDMARVARNDQALDRRDLARGDYLYDRWLENEGY